MGHERADEAAGKPSAVRASQDDRGAGVQIKNAGFRGFGVRGKGRVAGEFSRVCAAHNLKKIILAVTRGEVCPEFGKRAALA